MKATINGEDISDKLVFELGSPEPAASVTLTEDITVQNGDSITFTYTANTGGTASTTGYVHSSFSGPITLEPDGPPYWFGRVGALKEGRADRLKVVAIGPAISFPGDSEMAQIMVIEPRRAGEMGPVFIKDITWLE